MKKINFKSKKTWKKVLTVGLVCVLTLGAVFGITALVGKVEEETTKKLNLSWEVGGLDEQGKYLETKESIYTKDAFECKGLNIKMAFDNDVSYRIFFYDYNDEFVSSTELLTANYSADIDMFVKSARIVITPNEDSKISWYEKSGYAKQLTISVDKEQELPKKFVFDYSSSLATYNNFLLNASGFYNAPSDYTGTTYTIDLRQIKTIYSKVSLSNSEEDIIFAFVVEEPVLKGSAVYTTQKTFNSSAGMHFFDCEIPSDANYLVVEAINGYSGTEKNRTPDILFYN